MDQALTAPHFLPTKLCRPRRTKTARDQLQVVEGKRVKPFLDDIIEPLEAEAPPRAEERDELVACVVPPDAGRDLGKERAAAARARKVVEVFLSLCSR